jgi:glycerate kinase
MLQGGIFNFGMKIDKPVIGVFGINALLEHAAFYRMYSLTENNAEIDEVMKNTYKKVQSLVCENIRKELYE